jgi:hypothetical protein
VHSLFSPCPPLRFCLLTHAPLTAAAALRVFPLRSERTAALRGWRHALAAWATRTGPRDRGRAGARRARKAPRPGGAEKFVVRDWRCDFVLLVLIRRVRSLHGPMARRRAGRQGLRGSAGAGRIRLPVPGGDGLAVLPPSRERCVQSVAPIAAVSVCGRPSLTRASRIVLSFLARRIVSRECLGGLCRHQGRGWSRAR